LLTLLGAWPTGGRLQFYRRLFAVATTRFGLMNCNEKRTIRQRMKMCCSEKPKSKAAAVENESGVDAGHNHG